MGGGVELKKRLNPTPLILKQSLDNFRLSLVKNLMLFVSTLLVKGTVSVILSDPPCKESNVRFTTVPLKPKTLKDPVVSLTRNMFNSDNFYIVSHMM